MAQISKYLKFAILAIMLLSAFSFVSVAKSNSAQARIDYGSTQKTVYVTRTFYHCTRYTKKDVRYGQWILASTYESSTNKSMSSASAKIECHVQNETKKEVRSVPYKPTKPATAAKTPCNPRIEKRADNGSCVKKDGGGGSGGGGTSGGSGGGSGSGTGGTGLAAPSSYGGSGSGSSAGNSLSCKNVTNQFSKFFDYVNSKYKSVQSASSSSENTSVDKWVKADEALIAQRATEDATMKSNADKLAALADSDAKKQAAATKYIEELKAAVKENRNQMDMAKMGVDLSTDTAGKAEGESYRAQVLAAQGDKRESYLEFMKALVDKYDSSTKAANKNCNAAALNKLKNDAKSFKTTYKTDLTTAREDYQKALTTIRDGYQTKVGELKTNFTTRTDAALQTLLAEW